MFKILLYTNCLLYIPYNKIFSGKFISCKSFLLENVIIIFAFLVLYIFLSGIFHSYIICLVSIRVCRRHQSRLIRIIADVEKYESDKNRKVHSIHLLSSRRFPHPSRQEQPWGKLPWGHSDIFFPPTWDSGVLNHPEFLPAGYPPVPGSGAVPEKNEKRAYGKGKKGDSERKRGVGCRLGGRRSTRRSKM